VTLNLFTSEPPHPVGDHGDVADGAQDNLHDDDDDEEAPVGPNVLAHVDLAKTSGERMRCLMHCILNIWQQYECRPLPLSKRDYDNRI
jgi:hypothetical protein